MKRQTAYCLLNPGQGKRERNCRENGEHEEQCRSMKLRERESLWSSDTNRGKVDMEMMIWRT